MKCPYCDKEVYGFTGLQELLNFQRHMRRCRKSPFRQTVVNRRGEIAVKNKPIELDEALMIRHESGQ